MKMAQVLLPIRRQAEAEEFKRPQLRSRTCSPINILSACNWALIILTIRKWMWHLTRL